MSLPWLFLRGACIVLLGYTLGAATVARISVEWSLLGLLALVILIADHAYTGFVLAQRERGS